MTERVQPTSKFVTVNALRLHYLEWGKAGTPPRKTYRVKLRHFRQNWQYQYRLRDRKQPF